MTKISKRVKSDMVLLEAVMAFMRFNMSKAAWSRVRRASTAYARSRGYRKVTR